MISYVEELKRKDCMPDIRFNDIFKTYQKPIYNYVLRMVRDNAIAEELTQEIFIKTYKNLSSFRGDSKLSTWIYGIATNACLDYFRASDYKKGKTTDLLDEDVLTEETGSEDIKRILSIEEDLIKSEMAECIRDYIESLPGDYRTVIILHDLEGFKNREIAKIMGCTLDTVKIRLHRARRKLQSILASNCDFYLDKNNVLCCDKKSCHENCEE
ncbi:MAG: sigma-70 family RNA polymerase sigma factor [Candidatus Zixiibacteriota bacterium]|nr:MAG: sigma-70 family RNA polymerase sigma factor [candidate division Zixibacteria bacterium]